MPELIQHDMTAEKIAAAAETLLNNEGASGAMRADLAGVRSLLSYEGNPFERTASLIEQDWNQRRGITASGVPRPQETIK